MERGAEPVVLVPGLASDARVFAPQIVALSAGRAVHVGHVAEDSTIETMARSVLADAPARFALAGHSMGGIVALEIVRQAPDRVTRLALIASDCLADPPAVAAAREDLIVAARAGRLAEAMGKALPLEALAPSEARGALHGALLAMAEELGSETFVRHMRALQRRPDLQRTLRVLKVPVLILGGRHDRLCPPRRQEFMAGLAWTARLVLLEEAGHAPTLEAPEAVTAALAAWLDRQAPLTLRRSQA
jgi:pimeloyl-ACP methyl ester carboxylesterase